MATYSLTAGLLFEDDAAVAEVLAGAGTAEDVSFLMVWNARGRLVATVGAVAAPATPPVPEPEGMISAGGDHYVSTGAVLSGDRRVGTLSVGISLVPLRREVASSRRIGALVGALIFAIGLVVVYIISTRITRPLTAVAETVDRIAAGDLSLRATASSDFEVARLVQAFNRMVDTLVDAQTDLAALNAGLEARVDARTAELLAIIDVAPQAIVATDTHMTVTRWNRGAERLFGWNAAEVLGRPLPYVAADELELLRVRTAALARSDGSHPMEVTRRKRDGTTFRALLGVGVVHGVRQDAIGYIGFLTDLTEHKRLEEQLRQSQKLDALGQLAAGIAHDFNNILTVISKYAELMLHDARSREDREHLEQIAGAASRAAGLTRQLLTFTRQEMVQLQVLDVSAVVRTFEPMLRRVLPANIRITVACSGEARWVKADPIQLEQVVMNLVVNAADAMPAGGAVRIGVDRLVVDDGCVEGEPLPSGAYAVLSVEDTGTGIAPETLARMFEPFYTTKALGQGTGLGLSTTYGIVAGIGGGIRVASTVGRGTTLRVYLPETAERPMARRVAAEPLGTTATGRGTVLLVEDEPTVRRVVKLSLQRIGYTVWETSSGEEALGIAAERGDQVQVVITDIMMPGMTGRAFADKLGAVYPDLGIVFVSGYSESAREGPPVHNARRTFLQKPFTTEQIAAAIELVTAP
jgi:PAS domain S-box-containing protein